MEIFNFCNLEMPIGLNLDSRGYNTASKNKGGFSCRHSNTETPQDGNRGAEEERCEP